MAIQRNATIVKTPGIGIWQGYLKFKVTTASAGATCTILRGGSFISSVVLQGNGANNANVATVTFRDGIIDLCGLTSELEDDGSSNSQTGNYVTTGNPLNLGTTTACTVQVGYFLAAGTSNAFATNAIVYVGFGINQINLTNGN